MTLQILYRQTTPDNWEVMFTAIRLADTPLRRLRGLLGTDHLDNQQGLLISPCKRVHTLGMQIRLDVVFIDRAGCVLRCVPGLKPWRQVGSREARYTLELAAGSLQRSGLKVGDVLKWK